MTTDHLGQGTGFPFRFSPQTGRTVESEGETHVHDSIRQILGTRLGERLRRPDFGSRLHELVFEPNDRVLHALIRQYILEALTRWERRIQITRVEIQENRENPNPNHLAISIHYKFTAKNTFGNLVYPFYREP